MKKLLFILFATSTLLFTYCGSDDTTDTPPSPPTIDTVDISILDVTLAEGNIYAEAKITVELSAASTLPITANISTVADSAKALQDFIPFNNRPVLFLAGETSKEVTLLIVGDLLPEGDETFVIEISSVSGPANIVKGSATVTLTNDDTGTGLLDIPVSPVIDWSSLTNLPAGADIPYALFNFGQPPSIPNEEYTSQINTDDALVFDQKISPSGDTILYSPSSFSDVDPPEAFEYISDESTYVDSLILEPRLRISDISASEPIEEALDIKYNLIFYVGKNGGERVGPYTIDPVIRVFPR